MTTFLIAVASFFGFILAYHTYGRWLARRIFGLDPDAEVPSRQLRDNVDFVPSKKEVVFGHHFTSIAGTGPIVGPAIAVFWGWLPALLWVVFGSIFFGAVHDFGALIVSLRNRGQTVGEVAGRLISPRAKILFLTVLFLALAIVLAIFGLVIAKVFSLYPETVLSVWIEIPLAVLIGIWVYRKGGNLLIPSLAALAIMYAAIWVGVNYLPIDLASILPKTADGAAHPFWTDVVVWTLILFVYCFIASVLPVWSLLQPRDYINSHQLMLALGLLLLGFAAACFMGDADIVASTPAITPASEIPADAPPIFPFLFITIACGAISGFHCLVSSGTSSKQVASEADAQYIGYGAMLLEGALAVIVILACCAGIGMGVFNRGNEGASKRTTYTPALNAEGEQLVGREAWRTKYQFDTEKGGWSKHDLGQKVRAFIEGGANFLTSLGLPLSLGIGIIAVLVASFAATTLDTATRLQRYVIQELAGTMKIKPLEGKYAATAFALISAGAIALFAGDSPGKGGMVLWPLFGATNQLLAGLAFLVIVFYLWRRQKPIWFAFIPLVVMLFLPGLAMIMKIVGDYYPNEKYLLLGFSLGILGLQLWMIVEAIIMWPRAKGVLEEALPPLPAKSSMDAATAAAASEINL